MSGPWDRGDWLSLAALLATFVFGAVGWVLVWRKRGQLGCRLLLVSRLLDPPTSDLVGRLSVQLDGQPIHDPWFCIVEVRNHSVKDLTSTLFDQGRAIRLSLHAIIQLFSPSKDANNIEHFVAKDQICIGPDLLKGRSTWSALAITSGPPRLTVEEEKLDGFRFVTQEMIKRRDRIWLATVFTLPSVILGAILLFSRADHQVVLLGVAGVALVNATVYLYADISRTH